MNTDNPNEMAPPEMVLQAALEEPPQRLLDDYTDAIHALREKKFTFREIAEWLKKFGFEVDHNAVWRAYAKTVSDRDAYEEAEHDEELERDEAMREAELNGTLVTSSPERPAEPSVDAISAKVAAKKAKTKKKRCRRG